SFFQEGPSAAGAYVKGGGEGETTCLPGERARPKCKAIRARAKFSRAPCSQAPVTTRLSSMNIAHVVLTIRRYVECPLDERPHVVVNVLRADADLESVDARNPEPETLRTLNGCASPLRASGLLQVSHHNA